MCGTFIKDLPPSCIQYVAGDIFRVFASSKPMEFGVGHDMTFKHIDYLNFIDFEFLTHRICRALRHRANVTWKHL